MTVSLKKENIMKKILKISGRLLIGVILFCTVAGLIGYGVSKARQKGELGLGYVYTDEVRIIEDVNEQGIGTVEISTLKLDSSIYVDQATFTSSGRMLISYNSGNDTVIATLNDDGSDTRILYTGEFEFQYRLMPYKDNTRILLGDYVLECPKGQTLDTCDEGKATMIPIEYPSEFVDDESVMTKWTEIIISNDGEYIAWTMRRTDCGAANAMGHLVRYEDKYVIEDASFISSMNTYVEDEKKDGYLKVNPLIGGEVKQFVHGGTAISLVGAGTNGMADSVIQDIATGEVTQITYAPGYDETTLLSPDETIGIVMTSRFSEKTDLAVLGMVHRPYGDALHSIMAQIYMYNITGVRGAREGNIGPALIYIERSIEEEDYMGVDLSPEDESWTYHSPMSWNNDGTKASWIEKQYGTNGVRVQIVTLVDYVPGKRVADMKTPKVGDYADTEILDVDVSGIVEGKVSGAMTLTKKSGLSGVKTVEITYDNYSDDGVYYYNGTEYAKGSYMTKSTYTSNVKVTDKEGKEVGFMDVELYFSACLGFSFTSTTPFPKLDLKKSKGEAYWMDRKADVDQLVE